MEMYGQEATYKNRKIFSDHRSDTTDSDFDIKWSRQVGGRDINNIYHIKSN